MRNTQAANPSHQYGSIEWTLPTEPFEEWSTAYPTYQERMKVLSSMCAMWMGLIELSH